MSASSSVSNRINTRDDVFDDKEAAPRGYSLQQLLFVHRHGERTMVMRRFPEHPVHFTGECQSTRAFSVVRTTHTGHLQFEERILDTPHGSQTARFHAPVDDCALGQLTDRGALTLETLGQALRRRYIDQANLLPSRFDSSTILVQSTDVPRAIASSKFMLSGLYPARTRTASDAPVLHIRKPDDEIIYPNWSYCPRLRQISEQWKRQTGIAADMDDFKERLPVLFGLEAPPPGTAVDAQPPVNALAAKRPANVLMTTRTTHSFFDENAVRTAHDLPPLPGSTPENIAEAAELSTTEWFGQYNDPKLAREVCRIGIGPLFRDMLEQLTSPNPRKAVFYSGHDTTIAPLLSCVTAFDFKWPKYGSNVAFEVLQKDDTKEKFVQVRYNFARRVMQECLPFAPKDAPTLCPMAKFEEILKSRIPSDWEQECKKK
jgi:hypothetical protein